MSAHTPGPWVAFPKAKYKEWHVAVPVTGSSMKLALFDDGVRTDNPEADARLIAAAPDLLATLQKWLDADEHENMQQLIADSKAAIAKARA